MMSDKNPATGQSASQTGGSSTSSSRSEGSITSQAQQQARGLAQQAKEQVSTQAESQKERAAQTLGDIGRALHESSEQLRNQGRQTVARYTEDAAHQVDRLSSFLRERSVEDLMHRTERFARREPALFFGGAFVLGLLGARFFKSSSPSRGRYQAYGEPYYGEPYGRPYRERVDVEAYGARDYRRTYEPSYTGQAAPGESRSGATYQPEQPRREEEK